MCILNQQKPTYHEPIIIVNYYYYYYYYLIAPGTSESQGTTPSIVITNFPLALWTLSFRNIETCKTRTMKLRKLGGHTCVTRGEISVAKWKKNYLHILTKYMSKQSHNLNATNINLLPWLKKIIWVIGVLRRTVVIDWRFDNLCEAIFRVKW